MNALIITFTIFIVLLLLLNNSEDQNNYKKGECNHLTIQLKFVSNRSKPPPVDNTCLIVTLVCMISLITIKGTEATTEELAKDLTVALASCILAHTTK